MNEQKHHYWTERYFPENIPIGCYICCAMSIFQTTTIWVDFSFNYASGLRLLPSVITADWGRDMGYGSETELLSDVG